MTMPSPQRDAISESTLSTPYTPSHLILTELAKNGQYYPLSWGQLRLRGCEDSQGLKMINEELRASFPT